MPIKSIKQGESLDYSFDRGANSIDNWTCTITLKKYPADISKVNRVIVPTGKLWKGTLTNQDTKDLTVNQYSLIATLKNSATGEKEVQTDRFYVGKNW